MSDVEQEDFDLDREDELDELGPGDSDLDSELGTEDEDDGGEEGRDEEDGDEDDEDDLGLTANYDDDDEDDELSVNRSINETLRNSTLVGTSRFLNKYERTRIIGERARQLMSGAPPTIDIGVMTDVIKIAEAELVAGRLPMTIYRPYPDSKAVVVPVSQLIDVNRQA